MKNLSELIYSVNESQKEELTKDSLSKLTYLKKHLTNNEVQEIFNKYCSDESDYHNNFLVDLDKLETMLKNKGLVEFGPVKDTSKYILKLFRQHNNEKILNDLINQYFSKSKNKQNSIYKLKTTGNIFNDFCADWKEEAKELASITYKSVANVGPYEVLLKFLLQEAGTGASGDIQINSSQEFEVKCMTWGPKGKSGGHLAGQKGNDGQKIRKSWAIYMYINEKLFNFEINDNKSADLSEYFQNEKGFNKFKELCKNKKVSKTQLAKILVNAICFQYNYINNERNKEKQLNDVPSLPINIYNELYKQTESHLKNISDISYQEIKDIIGCIQFNLYALIENFDYIFIGFLSSKNNKDSLNGKYFFIEKDKNNILSFETILNNLYFGALESSEQGRTGKIYLKL